MSAPSPHGTQRRLHDAARASTSRGPMGEGCHRLPEEACAPPTGVELGGYDRRILSWLADWEPPTCAVVAGLITGASASAQRAPAVLAGNHDLTVAQQRTVLAALA